MKKIIILNHNGGRLGNQLWNYINILGYCIEKKYVCKNYCFYGYDRFFQTPLIHPLLDPLLKITPGRIKRKLHHLVNWYIHKKYPTHIIDSGDKKPIYFTEQTDLLDNATVYLNGWMVRSPHLIKKHYKQIRSLLTPTHPIDRIVKERFATLRKKYQKIIGIHIRKGDYKEYANGKFYFEEKDVREIIDSYNTKNNTSLSTLFYICSDGEINKDMFNGITTQYGNGNVVDDLYSLSMCDIIIGSDSTFGGVAAYLGNIPFVIFSHDKIDWSKAESKKFEYYNGSYNMQL